VLKRLISRLSGGPYYVRFGPKRLSVRDAKGSGRFDDEPIMALSEEERPTVLAIGTAARGASSRLINPFDHPRVVIGDFTIAQLILQHAFRVVSGSTPFRPSPIAVLHPVEKLAGGLTGIEMRALRELGEGAGAFETHIWQGRDLTDPELLAGVYRDAI
jgi:rod shape-determining protein MreB and related proteins